MTIEAMKMIGTGPSGFAGRRGSRAVPPRGAAFDLRQGQRRDQQHHAEITKGSRGSWLRSITPR